MNVEKFYSALRAFVEHCEKQGHSQIIGSLVTHLDQRLANPADATQQAEFSKFFQALREKGAKFNYGEVPASYRAIYEEVGLEPAFVDHAARSISNLLNENQLTLDVASKQIKQIKKEIDRSHESAKSTISSFQTFGISEDVIMPGTSELGFEIPRDEIKSSIAEFSKEVDFLKKLSGYLTEVATGVREDVKVGTISSSELLLFIIFAPRALKVLADAVFRFVEAFEKIHEIRKNYDQLKKSGVPDNVTEDLRKHMESLIEKAVQDEISNIETVYLKGPKTRKNELRNEGEKHLRQIAKKIEKGYGFEFRAEPSEDAENSDEDDASAVAAINKIAEQIKPKIGFGSDILSIEFMNDNDDDNGDGDEN